MSRTGSKWSKADEQQRHSNCKTYHRLFLSSWVVVQNPRTYYPRVMISTPTSPAGTRFSDRGRYEVQLNIAVASWNTLSPSASTCTLQHTLATKKNLNHAASTPSLRRTGAKKKTPWVSLSSIIGRVIRYKMCSIRPGKVPSRYLSRDDEPQARME